MNNETAPEVLIQIEFSGSFDEDVLDRIPEDPDVDAGLASGFDGERVLRLLASLGPNTLAALRRVALSLLGAERIEGISITRDGVTIASMRAADTEKVRELINDVFDRLERPGNP